MVRLVVKTKQSGKTESYQDANFVVSITTESRSVVMRPINVVVIGGAAGCGANSDDKVDMKINWFQWVTWKSLDSVVSLKTPTDTVQSQKSHCSRSWYVSVLQLLIGWDLFIIEFYHIYLLIKFVRQKRKAITISHNMKNIKPWWRHQMEAFSALLVLCAGNSPVTSEFPSQRPVTHSFGAFFDLRLNKRLSKPSRGRWYETSLCSLWRYCNA